MALQPLLALFRTGRETIRPLVTEPLCLIDVIDMVAKLVKISGKRAVTFPENGMQAVRQDK